jgi:hypothetical protein
MSILQVEGAACQRGSGDVGKGLKNTMSITIVFVNQFWQTAKPSTILGARNDIPN